ncbi:hypothetical protein MP638_005558 [Amoeboaphelidium occidentale]|nr:hypothetical protein MP638_005558 [Amoeboaphelidium occidentale]
MDPNRAGTSQSYKSYPPSRSPTPNTFALLQEEEKQENGLIKPIVEELLNTETSFIKDLDFVLDFIRGKVIKGPNGCLFDNDELEQYENALMSLWPIRDLHRRVEKRLKGVIRRDAESICNTLLEIMFYSEDTKSEFEKVHLNHCSQIYHASYVLGKFYDENVKYRELIDSIASSTVDASLVRSHNDLVHMSNPRRKMMLQDFILAPIKRLTQYPLFLGKMLDKTKAKNADKILSEKRSFGLKLITSCDVKPQSYGRLLFEKMTGLLSEGNSLIDQVSKEWRLFELLNVHKFSIDQNLLTSLNEIAVNVNGRKRKPSFLKKIKPRASTGNDTTSFGKSIYDGFRSSVEKQNKQVEMELDFFIVNKLNSAFSSEIKYGVSNSSMRLISLDSNVLIFMKDTKNDALTLLHKPCKYEEIDLVEMPEVSLRGFNGESCKKRWFMLKVLPQDGTVVGLHYLTADIAQKKDPISMLFHFVSSKKSNNTEVTSGNNAGPIVSAQEVNSNEKDEDLKAKQFMEEFEELKCRAYVWHPAKTAGGQRECEKLGLCSLQLLQTSPARICLKTAPTIKNTDEESKNAAVEGLIVEETPTIKNTDEESKNAAVEGPIVEESRRVFYTEIKEGFDLSTVIFNDENNRCDLAMQTWENAVKEGIMCGNVNIKSVTIKFSDEASLKKLKDFVKPFSNSETKDVESTSDTDSESLTDAEEEGYGKVSTDVIEDDSHRETLLDETNEFLRATFFEAAEMYSMRKAGLALKRISAITSISDMDAEEDYVRVSTALNHYEDLQEKEPLVPDRISSLNTTQDFEEIADVKRRQAISGSITPDHFSFFQESSEDVQKDLGVNDEDVDIMYLIKCWHAMLVSSHSHSKDRDEIKERNREFGILKRRLVKLKDNGIL